LQAQSLRTLFVCAPRRLVALPHQVSLAPRRLVAQPRRLGLAPRRLVSPRRSLSLQFTNGLRLISDDGAELGAADALAARRVAADL